MPLAAIPLAIGAAGSISSGVGGKKASNAGNKLAQSQLALQQGQFGLAKQQVGLGNAAIAPASSYWNALLSGNRAAAQQATGPYASLMGEAAQGGRTAIGATTPRGGEQNLALAQNYNQLSNNISRLYAGMQPLAAQQLQGIGGEYLGSGASFNPQANIGGAFANYANQQQQAQQAGQGYGSLLYQALNKLNRPGASPSVPGGAGMGGFGGWGNLPLPTPTFPGISTSS